MNRKHIIILIIIILAFIIPASFLTAEISYHEINSNNDFVNYSPLHSSPGSQIKDLYVSGNNLLEGQFKSKVTIAAAGDIMVHSPQFNSAFDASQGTYDFSKHFSTISPYLKNADLAVANLETTLTGTQYPNSGYPRFNSPPELAGNLKDSGFDLLFTANNHSLDYGEIGVLNTIEYLESAGLDFVGTARDSEEQLGGHQVIINNINISFFAYTYGTNGIPIPYGKDYMVSLIDEKQITEDTQRAKNEHGADVVIVSLHWGHEYQRLPTNEQRELAGRLINAGVDVIVGTHSHVVQPAEVMNTDNNSGLVLYSLGNFISNQRKRYRDSGIIVYFKIEKDLALGKTNVSLTEIEPTWVLRRSRLGPERYSILPVKELLLEKNTLEEKNLTNQDIERINEVIKETEDIFWKYLK